MLEHFGIDRLVEYETEPIPETARVVNPKYRALESEIRKINSKRARLLAQFGSIKLEAIDEPHMVKRYETKMAQLREEITIQETELNQLKQQRKKHPKLIAFAQLPQEEKFQKLATDKKHFIDTIKMIAYWAETALANIIRPKMVRRDEARSVIRQIFSKDVNLKPDKANKRLTIELHNLTNEYEDKLGQIICDTLNENRHYISGN